MWSSAKSQETEGPRAKFFFLHYYHLVGNQGGGLRHFASPQTLCPPPPSISKLFSFYINITKWNKQGEKEIRGEFPKVQKPRSTIYVS